MTASRLILGGVLFVLLATANAAGYRYGAADQAFYIPVVLRAADPSAFPRDGTMLDAQGRFMVLDEILAGAMRTTGISIEALFFGGYLVSLALTWAGLVLIGTRVYHSAWVVAALAAAFTLRHRIPRTSANSFEPYFHPRMLAFSLGLLAVAAVLRRRTWTAVALVALAAIVHVTTALWFAVMLGVALAILDPRLRRIAFGAGAAAAVAGGWALASGRLDAALAPMDDVWLQAMSGKDSLLPAGWPVWAWVANLGFLALLWAAHRSRIRRGAASDQDAALVWGATALVALFLVTLPLVSAHATLPVQLQISRVFWLVDVVALVYVLDVVAGTGSKPPDDRDRLAFTARSPLARRQVAVAALLVAFSAGRGMYVMFVERPERPLFAVHLPQSPWEDAMRWVARLPAASHVLADPGHAWKHGTSVRASGRHDVFLEEVKDSAMAIYSRDVAMRVLDRVAAISDFGALTPERAQDLARQYDVNYLVTESDLPLPLAYRNERFRIYLLKDTREDRPLNHGHT